jgi:hypothetical protein
MQNGDLDCLEPGAWCQGHEARGEAATVFLAWRRGFPAPVSARYNSRVFHQVPSGFKPLLLPVGGTVGANIDGSKVIESIGSLLTKGGLGRGERVLLNFVYPSAWIISVPTSTGNGESGTVSANNYVKGDSAVVCALPLDEDEEIADKDKVYFQDLMTQSVPANLWQNFKLVKKTPAGDASFPLAQRRLVKRQRKSAPVSHCGAF